MRDVLLAYPKIVRDHATDCLSEEECAGEVTIYALRSHHHGRELVRGTA